MIRWADGDMLDRWDLVPVVPVNCVGVAGAGLAKQWAERYPGLALLYLQLCRTEALKPGFPRMLATARSAAVMFPTKDHWRNPSDPHRILQGLLQLAGLGALLDVQFAVPMLGCGLGGLDWETVVRPMVVQALGDASGTFHVFGKGTQ